MNRIDIIHRITILKKQLEDCKKTQIVYNSNYKLRENAYIQQQAIEKKIAFYVNLIGDAGKYDNENFKKHKDYK